MENRCKSHLFLFYFLKILVADFFFHMFNNLLWDVCSLFAVSRMHLFSDILRFTEDRSCHMNRFLVRLIRVLWYVLPIGMGTSEIVLFIIYLIQIYGNVLLLTLYNDKLVFLHGLSSDSILALQLS